MSAWQVSNIVRFPTKTLPARDTAPPRPSTQPATPAPPPAPPAPSPAPKHGNPLIDLIASAAHDLESRARDRPDGGRTARAAAARVRELARRVEGLLDAGKVRVCEAGGDFDPFEAKRRVQRRRRMAAKRSREEYLRGMIQALRQEEARWLELRQQGEVYREQAKAYMEEHVERPSEADGMIGVSPPQDSGDQFEGEACVEEAIHTAKQRLQLEMEYFKEAEYRTQECKDAAQHAEVKTQQIQDEFARAKFSALSETDPKRILKKMMEGVKLHGCPHNAMMTPKANYQGLMQM
ncbi:unnamed protein product [Ostreobium quekettii]|uniref:Uncharacterized protein n=1 Tax=Ostreobium quekettii TaxID=121088 RepID=A0A8S1J7Z8_9CHLO|nr:unnamed protein product [Ostreobium quekettii]